MMDEGVILTFEVSFETSLLQLNTCIADVKLKRKFIKSEIITELRKIQNIFFVTCEIGDIFTVMFYYESSRDLEGMHHLSFDRGS